MTDVIENRSTKERQNIFPFARILNKPPYKLFNGREHQELFAHLFNQRNSPDAQLQKKVLPFGYFDKLADDDGGEEKDHNIDDVMGMIHGEAVLWLREEKIEGEQANDR